MATFSSSLFKTWFKVLISFPEKNALVSSANKMNLRRFEELDMSLMHKINSRGPKMLPCGIPHVTVLWSDEVLLYLL